MSRELINRIQNLRKSSGFDVTDKIDVRIFAEGEDAEDISGALGVFSDYIAAQTLSRSISLGPVSEKGSAAEVEWNEKPIYIGVTR